MSGQPLRLRECGYRAVVTAFLDVGDVCAIQDPELRASTGRTDQILQNAPC